ncbi:protein-glutamine gamma-glutamyltransferase [Domibacillus aminovorans]|uniref:Protein-glutamine gamma-glutamyltransferase n=1 Tax=Domibacillus aminovorans TaxID=29332 RepID=A0A177KXZ1_9BACI|nr:protein-glutamine gamma-glutamyltransferase [Domibacillus aminovorans]OAH57865.1 protein-glutamine gamma-glutamyltransferase [Domibacillus aminovorans]
MIQLSGMPFQQRGMWPSGSIESIIIQQMNKDTVVYSYRSIGELSFELKLRKNIILSARAMNQSNVRFAVFAKSRCNPQYWYLTNTGGFMLRNGVKPSDAIQDIYRNSSQYAFECATAKVIIYYHAVLNLIGESLFNQLFQNIYLYSWHADPDLGITSNYTGHFLPGDVVYFKNPDFDPQTPQWRGENAVVLGDGTYFGHGLGIKTAKQMIHALNRRRKPGTNQSAYLTNVVTRPSFKHLAKLSMSQRGYSVHKYQHIVVQHNESSISFDQYVFYL